MTYLHKAILKDLYDGPRELLTWPLYREAPCIVGQALDDLEEAGYLTTDYRMDWPTLTFKGSQEAVMMEDVR